MLWSYHIDCLIQLWDKVQYARYWVGAHIAILENEESEISPVREHKIGQVSRCWCIPRYALTLLYLDGYI